MAFTTQNEQNYLDTLRKIRLTGDIKTDRTGTGTISLFGTQQRYDLSQGFPLLTTKKVTFKQIVSELLWFISGSTNVRDLIKNKNYIWDSWAIEKYFQSDEYDGPDMTDFGHRIVNDEDFKTEYLHQRKLFHEKILNDDDFAARFGDLGPVYGKQWRDFDGTDQLTKVIQQIKDNPHSRRLIVTAWNPSEVDDMALPPCHAFFQFYVNNNKLSLQLYQRSADYPIGVPYNIASYSLLLAMVAKECDLEVGEFVHTTGDTHIYLNQLEGVDKQLERVPLTPPKLWLNPEVKSIFDYDINDIRVMGYEPQSSIVMPVSV